MPGQVEQSRRDIINKLSVLEYVIGFRNYRIYEPSQGFSSADVISLQKEASSILQFLGMERYMAIIAYSSVATNTAGHIELNDYDDSQSVFITIGEKYRGNDKAVLCIMAHEICHKLLHIRKFKGKTVEENEVYTDLAAIYTGLGRLILNGCFKQETEWLGNVSRTTTQTIGYLSKENYAYAYVTMSSFYGIKRRQYLAGIDKSVKWTVREVFPPHLARKWFDFKIGTLTKRYTAALRRYNAKPAKHQADIASMKQILRKYSYADDVRTGTGFSKPITAYSLILEPILWKPLLGIPF